MLCWISSAKLTSAWGGLDTLHILAGVPSTQTLLDIAGVSLQSGSFSSDTTSSGLEQVAAEARACSDVNYLGTILAVAAFVRRGLPCSYFPIPLFALTFHSPVTDAAAPYTR